MGWRSSDAPTLFAATLGGHDPEAPARWAISGMVVVLGTGLGLGGPALALGVATLLAPIPADPPPSVWVSLGDEVAEPGLFEHVPLASTLTAPTPQPPAPVVRPEATPEPELAAQPTLLDVEPEPTPTPDDPAPDDSPRDAVAEVTETGDAPAASTGDPARASGTSAELAPGEMATCLVQPTDRAWDVQGCADGLHPDAIELAREARARGLVLVTLRGS